MHGNIRNWKAPGCAVLCPRTKRHLTRSAVTAFAVSFESRCVCTCACVRVCVCVCTRACVCVRVLRNPLHTHFASFMSTGKERNVIQRLCMGVLFGRKKCNHRSETKIWCKMNLAVSTWSKFCTICTIFKHTDLRFQLRYNNKISKRFFLRRWMKHSC